jgi:hypothetical protein
MIDLLWWASPGIAGDFGGRRLLAGVAEGVVFLRLVDSIDAHRPRHPEPCKSQRAQKRHNFIKTRI